MRLHVAQVLDNGRYGDTRPFIPAALSFSSHPGFLQGDDLVLVQQLKERCSKDRELLDIRDAGLLQRILATGRCYLETLVGEPLHPARAIAARPEWKMDEHGVQSARWVCEAGDALLLQLDAPWYLDERTGACGPLETGLPAASALALIATPVSLEEVAAVRGRLQSEAVADFPLPKPLVVEQRDAVEPVSHLAFESHRYGGRGRGEAESIDLLCLDFSYAGHRFGREDETSWVEGETVVRCPRDPVREAACLDTLLGLGLVRDEQWSRRLGRDCLRPPDLEDWRQFQQASLPALLQQGWQVNYAAGFRQRLAQLLDWRQTLEQEAKRYAPSLSVLLLHGPARRDRFVEIPRHDLVLTTYPLLGRDLEALQQHSYHLLILDEAQLIKNPRTQAGQAVRALQARHRLCQSGTPMENHLGELWSLFDFLLPGLLGNARQFRRLFRNPIEKQGDPAVAELLARRVRPFMLRRTKAGVAAELPPRTEIVRSVPLEGGQSELYESIRLAMHEKVRKAVADKGVAGSQIVILDSLLKLRQVCCDPRLVKLKQAATVQESAKLALLMELLPELLDEGRRILLFSQFTGMLELNYGDTNYGDTIFNYGVTCRMW